MISFFACQEKTEIKRGKLLSSELVATISKDSINAYFPERLEMDGSVDSLPKYDIDLYKISYGSIYQDSLVQLSGLIVVPKKEGTYTYIQYHHGTLLPYPAKDGWGSLDAPSHYQGTAPKAYKEQYETRLYGNYLGSYGFLVGLPDYAGYGISQNLEHPYSVNRELSEETVDFIKAVEEFAKKRTLKLNKGIGLAGWSEGGAISVATQKRLEREYKDVKIIANTPMSGFLNVAGKFPHTAKQLPYVNMDMGEGLDFVAWAYYCYNRFSDKPVDFNKIFKFSVANQLDVLKKRPSNNPSEVFQILDAPTFDFMVEQVGENTLASGWTPKAPLFIHQGTADKVVPYENNSETAVKNLSANGGNVKLMKYEGYTHSSLGLLQLNNMIKEFNQGK